MQEQNNVGLLEMMVWVYLEIRREPVLKEGRKRSLK